MARAVSCRVQEKPPTDPDATAQLERPPGGTIAAPPPPTGAPPRRQADRWSTVFTVFLRGGRPRRVASPRRRGDHGAAGRDAIREPFTLGIVVAELAAVSVSHAGTADGHAH
jgi:hypothetical protein